jgi:hypothetical protein
MSPLKLMAATALMALTAPLAAQSTVQPAPALPPTTPLATDRGYDKDTPRTDAVNAVEAPVTAALNDQVATADAGAAAINATNQEAYAADMARYRTKVTATNNIIVNDAIRYDRQQRAYADAMSAWRMQAAACKKGKRKACNAPSPDPADFY